MTSRLRAVRGPESSSAALLDRLLAQLPAVARRTAVIDVAREAIEPMLALKGVAAVVETHQYRAWKNGEPADAAVYGDLAAAGLIRRELTPVAEGRYSGSITRSP